MVDLKIGLALGAGGANGLAHILMLEVFDELGIKPDIIAGSSIGAVIGALYASGSSATAIRELVENLIIRETDTLRHTFLEKSVFKWLEFVDPNIGNGGLIKGDGFLAFLYNYIKVDTFEELAIPLRVVATDFWRREAVVLGAGLLAPAIQGSMSIPGLFTPVEHDDKLLVDGGTVNPVPYDVLFDACDITVAINVAGRRSPKKHLTFMESVFNTYQIMQHAIIEEKLARRPPDIYIAPEIADVRTLEFQKMDFVHAQAQPAKKQLKQQLSRRLGL